MYNPFLVALYGKPGWPMLALLDLIDKLSQKKKLIIVVQKKAGMRVLFEEPTESITLNHFLFKTHQRLFARV